MKKINFKDKKMLYAVLCVLIVSIFTLTMAYAVLNVTLNISGSAQVNATNWDIHLENPVVKSGSATTNVPTITGGNSLTFTTTLTTPGDFYEFTVDVVNGGGIDAMIDSITKTPELTENQAKYLTYEISYQNGESITSKQNLAAGSTTSLKVKVAYRTDLSASDLPTTVDTLSLSITVKYVQSDGTGSDVKDNGVEKVKPIADGSLDTPGTLVTIDSEQFYTIGVEENNVKLLSMWYITQTDNPKQSIDAGRIAFSSSNYWSSTVSTYPAYVYDSNSIAYSYIENYKSYLEGLGIIVNEARLVSREEIDNEKVNCSSYKWLCNMSYWIGTASDSSTVNVTFSNGTLGRAYYYNSGFGIRPVIVISKDLF